MRALRIPLTLTTLLAACACVWAVPQADLTGRIVGLDNGIVRVRFDTTEGVYDIVDSQTGETAIANACASVGETSTNDPGMAHAVSSERFSDTLGSGRRLCVESRAGAEPRILLQFSLYDGASYVVLRTGIANASNEPVRLASFLPMVGGDIYSRGGPKQDLRLLNGPSGANQTRVSDGPHGRSTNLVLATFEQEDARRSVVLAALETADFVKSAAVAPQGGALGSRLHFLREAVPGTSLVAYEDSGPDSSRALASDVSLSLAQGTRFQWSGPNTGSLFSSIVFDDNRVVYEASGLDPRRSYALGLSWWDYDANGRTQSVLAIDSAGNETALVASAKLPAFRGAEQAPEQRAVVLPSEAYADGRVQFAFTNDTAVPNAAVSELWLWEMGEGARLTEAWSAGHGVTDGADARAGLAQLEAMDPVGRLVDPGERYIPADSFYVDVITQDPFDSLETYGRALKAVMGAEPNPYTFPTVCAWYAGVWDMPGAQNHPENSRWLLATSPGLVEEIDEAKASGFLRYAPVAGRIVPDNYTENNPQGWWDDQHWQEQRFYVAPHETSKKWGQAMKERGGLAFTYFQAPLLSKDFRDTHTELLIAEDPARTLDYTKPATREYMRGVYDRMRGAISGMMFDYCDEMWANVSSHGDFADPHATATSFYREFLKLAKEGLGPDSWIHERSLSYPDADLALGIVDSQRTNGDTDRIDPAMVSRSGLRWYKNRVVVHYDMDSKSLEGAWKLPGWAGTDEDGRRMMLTMSYVAASRLLLATSFREMSDAELWDLSRTFPYHTQPKSARPVDAFIAEDWPQVYDFDVTKDWRQLTLYNTDAGAAQVIRVPLSGDRVEGALGLDPAKRYYAFDFWNEAFLGAIDGVDSIEQELRAGEARMISLHAVEDVPQFLSTNRHIMQGYLDMAAYPTWDSGSDELSGVSHVVGGETYEVVLALNGYTPIGTSAGCEIEALGDGLAKLRILRPANETVAWKVRFER